MMELEAARGSRRWAGPAALLLILAVGFVVRVWDLAGESFWWDEYTSLMHLRAPDLLQFLDLNRTLDPATLPLYYTLEYLWYHAFGQSYDNLRYLSILIGLAGVALLYVLGRRMFGEGGGLVAAACMALSPIHAFHAQGIRMYVLMTLLGLWSAYSFVRLLEDRTARWWLLHGLGNLLLLWTHPFALLLPGVEGLFLLCFRYRSPKFVAAWAGVNALAVLPLVGYLSTVRFWPKNRIEFEVPAIREWLGDVFADDVISLTYQLRVPGEAWRPLRDVRGIMDGVLIVMIAVVLILALVGARRNRRKSEPVAFLLLWLIVPPLVLYLLSVVWRPCIMPRYTLPSSLALYLLVAAASASLRRRWAGIALAVVFLSLTTYQLALAKSGNQRTNWKEAATIVADRGEADNSIAVCADAWKGEVFSFNLGDAHRVEFSIEEPDMFAEYVAALLGAQWEEAGGGAASSRIWAIALGRYFDPAPLAALEDAFTLRRLRAEKTTLPGIETVFVYALHVDPAYWDYPWRARLAEKLRAHLDESPETDPLYGNLLRALERGDAVLARLRAVYAVLRAFAIQVPGRQVEELERAVTLDPALTFAQSELGVALLDEGRMNDAAEALRSAATNDADCAIRFGYFIARIERGEDIAQARTAMNLVVQAVGPLGAGQPDAAMTLLKEAEQAAPDYGLVRYCKALAFGFKGDRAGFRSELAAAVDVDPAVAALLGPLLEMARAGADDAALEMEMDRLIGLGLDFPKDLFRAMGRP